MVIRDFGSAQYDPDVRQNFAHAGEQMERALDVPQIAGGSNGLGLRFHNSLDQGLVAAGLLFRKRGENGPLLSRFRAFQCGSQAGCCQHVIFARRGDIVIQARQL